jgi:hypothetical protein
VHVALRLVACALTVASAGCAGIVRGYDLAPNGLPRQEARVRDWMAAGRADSALARLTRSEFGPSDDVLRALFIGATAHYAGDDETSAAWLEYAALAADDRATKSVSRSALSLLANDRVLPYEPSRTERLFIPYYAALGRLRGRDVEGAAVEARRLSALLERFDADGWSAPSGLRATLRYLAGVVFEAAGERNDAAVAYRNAALLANDLVLATDTSWATSAIADEHDDLARTDSGDVVVLVEHGYVAHRAGEALHVLLAGDEVHTFVSSSDQGRADLASLIAARVLKGDAPPSRSHHNCADDGPCAGRATGHATNLTAGDESKKDEADREPLLLKVAWPVMRSSFQPTTGALVLVGDSARAMYALADVSAAAMTDFDSERPLILARTIARAALRAAVARSAEKKAREKKAETKEAEKGDRAEDKDEEKEKDKEKKKENDNSTARLVSALASASALILEQPDIRSWHLLPARLSIIRLRLPAGLHALSIQIGDRRVELGAVEVPANGVAVASSRIW